MIFKRCGSGAGRFHYFMNKKTITLKLDICSKILLLVLGAGVWLMALKPVLGPSQALAELDSFDLRNIERELSSIERQLSNIGSTLSNISLSMPN